MISFALFLISFIYIFKVIDHINLRSAQPVLFIVYHKIHFNKDIVQLKRHLKCPYRDSQGPASVGVIEFRNPPQKMSVSSPLHLR